MSPYRRARTRIGRALNHWSVWPVIVGLILGYALYGASDAHASPDQAVINFEARYATAVCSVLDQYPTISAIPGIAEAIVEEGFTYYEAGQVIAMSVRDECPRHLDLVQRFVSRYSQAGSKTA